MRKPLLVLPILLGAALSACGPDNGLGFYVSGTVHATLTDPTGTTTTGFDFVQTTRVDPSVPDSGNGGFTGVCQIGPNGRSLRLQRIGGDPRGMTEVQVSMPAWEQDSCTNCNHGTLTTVIGGATFTGVEQRGGATSQCTFTSDRRGSFGMGLHVTCAGLTASGDTHSVSIATDVTLDECDGPNSGG